jgi:hypothetical protein
MNIRAEIPEDAAIIRAITIAAFEGAPHSSGGMATSIVSRGRLDWLAGAAGFESLHLRIEFAKTLSSGRERSIMRISSKVVVSPPCQRKSQAMTNTSGSDSEMQRFESCRPSHPVRLQRVTYEGRSKTARYREVSQI